jgi:hypothetical protein
MPVGLGQLEHGISRRRVVHEARGGPGLVMFCVFVFNRQIPTYLKATHYQITVGQRVYHQPMDSAPDNAIIGKVDFPRI